MARKPTTAATTETSDQTSSKAITKSKYDGLMRRMITNEKERKEAAGADREKIGEAVENDNLHAKAFSWTKMLKKMSQTKRDELLFHLMTYFKYEGWPGEDLLADRSSGDEGEPEELNGHDVSEPSTGPRLDPPPDDDNVRDLRPRHLRSGSSNPDPNLKH